MPLLKSFKDFNADRTNDVVICFGRYQPPHRGHEKMIDTVSSLATENRYRIFTSQTSDAKKNPLIYEEKIRLMRKMFPKAGRNIIEDTSVHTIFDALVKLYKQDFTKVTLVVGEDRLSEFRHKLIKYNGVLSGHGLYEFRDGLEVISCGARDPDSDDTCGVSASRMREAVLENSLTVFKSCLPLGFTNQSDIHELFTAVQSGLGCLSKNRLQTTDNLLNVSNRREDFVSGRLFKVGDHVRIIESGEVGVISERGPNFLRVQTPSGQTRKWLDAVDPIL